MQKYELTSAMSVVYPGCADALRDLAADIERLEEQNHIVTLISVNIESDEDGDPYLTATYEVV